MQTDCVDECVKNHVVRCINRLTQKKAKKKNANVESVGFHFRNTGNPSHNTFRYEFDDITFLSFFLFFFQNKSSKQKRKKNKVKKHTKTKTIGFVVVVFVQFE